MICVNHPPFLLPYCSAVNWWTPWPRGLRSELRLQARLGQAAPQSGGPRLGDDRRNFPHLDPPSSHSHGWSEQHHHSILSHLSLCQHCVICVITLVVTIRCSYSHTFERRSAKTNIHQEQTDLYVFGDQTYSIYVWVYKHIHKTKNHLRW